jgi:hypothetical protein
MNNGYTLRPSGLLLRQDAIPEGLSPADGGLDNGSTSLTGDIEPTESPRPSKAGNPEVEDAPASWRVRLARRRALVKEQLAAVPDRRIDAAMRRFDRAVHLEVLAGDPRAEAWANRRFRFWALSALSVLTIFGAALSATFSALSVTTALSLMGAVWFTVSMGPDLLMGGMLALTLAMRAVLAQRGMTISPESAAAYRRIDRVLGTLIGLITVGPSLGSAVATCYRVVFHGTDLDLFGWSLISVAIHSIGPVVVAAAAAAAPAVTGDLARISQLTARRIRNNATTSQNAATSKDTTYMHTPTAPPTSQNGGPPQLGAHDGPTTANFDSIIERIRHELGPDASGKQIGRWYREHIGRIGQERITEIRAALRAE